MTRGGGPRVVLVHGFTQTGRSFDAIAEELASSYEVTTVDLPGHGRNGSVHVADLGEAADLLGSAGGRATYVGYSLGGRLCLTLALSAPDLIERLVLVGATAGIEDEIERSERADDDDALAERLERGAPDGLDLEAFLEQWLAGPLFSHLSPDARGLEARRENTTAGLAMALRALSTGRQPPSWKQLYRLAMPVLVLAGENDTRYVALSDRLAQAIGPNARAATIADVGHAAPFEAPAAFIALLESFLEESAGR